MAIYRYDPVGHKDKILSQPIKLAHVHVMIFRNFILAAALLAFAAPVNASPSAACNKDGLNSRSNSHCAAAQYTDSGTANDRVDALRNNAGIAAARFDFPIAETALREAIASLLGSEGTADAGEENALYLDLAMVIAAQGKLEEAKVLLARISPLVEAAANTSEQARLTGYRSQLADLEGNRSEARVFAADAVKRWREIAEPADGAAPPGAVAELAMALNAEARLLLRDREITTATIEASEALLLFDKVADAPKWWRAEILATLGETSMSVGRVAAAETYFKAAITQRRSLFGEGAETARMRLTLGRALTREGLYTAAIVTYREAFAALRQVGYKNIRLRADQLVPMALAVSEYASRIEDPAARQGAYAEAHEAFQLASDPAGERFILSSTERMRAASPQLAAALRQIDDAELEYWRRRSELSRLQALPQIDRKIDLERSAGQAMTDQQARLDGLSRKLAADFPDYRRLTDRRPPTLDELRSRLQPGEAVATFLIGSEGSFVEIVRRDRIAIAAVPLTRAELAASVARLRRGLETAGGASGDFDLAEAHRLYRALFGGVEGSLSDVSRLLLVPSAALGSLPLGILVREAPTNTNPASAHWLVRDMSVIRVPSTASFIALRSTRPVNPPAKQILAVADPAFAGVMDTPSPSSAMPSGADPCAQSGLSRELARLPALPETAAEATAVVRMLAGTDEDLLLGRSATLAGLNGRGPGDYRVLYFATHAVMPGELRCARDGGLALTADANSASGLLTPADIATLPLQAELVVLSACNTGSTGPGDESSLSGLAGAFLHAGARSLLITHWQVPSRATSNLMIDLFSRLQQAKGGEAASVDQALRAAQLKLISDPATAPPTFWGAFELLGAGTAADFQGSGA